MAEPPGEATPAGGYRTIERSARRVGPTGRWLVVGPPEPGYEPLPTDLLIDLDEQTIRGPGPRLHALTEWSGASVGETIALRVGDETRSLLVEAIYEHAFDQWGSYSGRAVCVCGFSTAHYALATDSDPEFEAHLIEVETHGETVRGSVAVDE